MIAVFIPIFSSRKKNHLFDDGSHFFLFLPVIVIITDFFFLLFSVICGWTNQMNIYDDDNWSTENDQDEQKIVLNSNRNRIDWFDWSLLFIYGFLLSSSSSSSSWWRFVFAENYNILYICYDDTNNQHSESDDKSEKEKKTKKNLKNLFLCKEKKSDGKEIQKSKPGNKIFIDDNDNSNMLLTTH